MGGSDFPLTKPVLESIREVELDHSVFPNASIFILSQYANE